MSIKAALIVAGVQPSIASREAPLAASAMLEFSITSQARAEMFLAQVLHESAGLQFFEEIASGDAYEGRCADLGNCRHGDGRRYKGRGPIQLTGRANYRWAGHLLGLALEEHPELAAQHTIGWRIAGLYWKSRGLNELADRGDFLAITKRINGGMNGLASRQRYRGRLHGNDCRPHDRWSHYTPAERRWIAEYDHKPSTERRAVLRHVMAEQRKRIWQEAQRSGWERANRRARWRSLRARTA
ncbi:MAG TPA: glycoside hydrolase family 19 protein [Solirubrobacteraceae bacterium]|jgi:predicted chitinase|nr:glycoside hydrolase family 19 protein [Solirubrobacteraceae bacterium]